MLRIEGEENRGKVQRYIDEHWKRYYCAPSIRDICDGTGIVSTSMVKYVVDTLVREKRILRPELSDGLSRQIVPLWVKDMIDHYAEVGK